VQVPIIFKLAIDWLSAITGSETALASFNEANSTMLALFVSPAAILIGYGIARMGATACNGTSSSKRQYLLRPFFRFLILMVFFSIFSSSSFFKSELRNAVFSKVALGAIRAVSRKVPF
jgi:ATP-binding cassette, subfamily B (MDR/TAP), member 7